MVNEGGCKMTYIKPLCLCGSDLYLWEQIYTTNEYKILKNGTEIKMWKL